MHISMLISLSRLDDDFTASIPHHIVLLASTETRRDFSPSKLISKQQGIAILLKQE